jgi:hypothetical protein
MTPEEILAEAMAHFGYTDAIWYKTRPSRTRPGGTFTRMWSCERANVWTYLRDKGMTYPAIGAATYSTHSTIVQALREAGLKLELRALARDRATLRATIAHDALGTVRAPKAPKPAPKPKPAPEPIPAPPAKPLPPPMERLTTVPDPWAGDGDDYRGRTADVTDEDD